LLFLRRLLRRGTPRCFRPPRYPLSGGPVLINVVKRNANFFHFYIDILEYIWYNEYIGGKCMKKNMFCIFLLLSSINVFSQESSFINELQVSIGYECNLFFVNGNNQNATNIHKIGFDIRAYDFWNYNDIGVFAKIGIFPFIDSGKFLPINGKPIMGVGFRKIFNNENALQFGFGLTEITYSSEGIFGFGLGGEILYKHDFTNKVFLSIGLDVTNDFRIAISSDRNNYNIFGIQPFINVGINFGNKKTI
jgi:hypothetical protein